MALSPIGLGAVKLGRTKALKYPEHRRLPEMAQVARLLERARLLGLNWIDTAVAYGQANTRLGRLGVGTDPHWRLCLKIGEQFSRGRSSYDFRASALSRDLLRALEQLGTPAVDILLLHLPANEEARAYEAGLDFLRTVKASGGAEAIGASTHSACITARVVAELDVAMIELNLTDRKLTEVVVNAPPGSVLIKKPFRNGWLLPPYGTSTALGALTYCLGPSCVIGAAIGTISPDHLKECADAANSLIAYEKTEQDELSLSDFSARFS